MTLGMKEYFSVSHLQNSINSIFNKTFQILGVGTAGLLFVLASRNLLELGLMLTGILLGAVYTAHFGYSVRNAPRKG